MRSLALVNAALAAVAPLAAVAQPATAHPAAAHPAATTVSQRPIGTRTAPVLERDGLRFRDLNRNGVVDPYEDWRLGPDVRARDLVGRMTLDEKAGAMMHGTARAVGPFGMAGVGAAYDTAADRALIVGAHVTSLITRLAADPRTLAAQNNALQAIAEAARLGIPVTVSTDPRHHFQYVLGASAEAGGFSTWPEPLGLAALGDAALVRRFADVARQEYRAVGLHETLSPQADLATEPRWSRGTGTFGEDAGLAGRMVRAYIEGFQHGRAGADSAGVLAVVKHWVGYGAQRNGFDSHNAYGQVAVFPGNNLAYHVRPFLAAFAAHVAGVMPTYSILSGVTVGGRALEPVGAGYSRQLLTDELRTRYGWTIVSDPAQADVAIVRADAPFERLHPQYVFGSMQHEGSLAFRDGNADYEAIKRASAVVPTIVTVYLDRPAILTNVRDRAAMLLTNFGVSDAALLDVLTGRATPAGRLPFELPSSMAEVEAQQSDVPHDTPHPLYRFGYSRLP